MIFDDGSLAFHGYEQSLQSPDLRPISLPMSGFEKAHFEGMINFSDAATALPESDCFGPCWPSEFNAPTSEQFETYTDYHQNDPDYYSDSDYGYSYDNDSHIEHTTAQSIEQAPPLSLSNGNVQASSRKRKASPTLEYLQPPPQKRLVIDSVPLPATTGDYYDSAGHASSFTPVVQTVRPMTQYAVAQVPLQSPRPGHHHSTSVASQTSLTAPSPLTPAFSPSLHTVRTEPSPRAPMTPVPRSASAASHVQPHPKLVRTSTIPQSSPPAVATSIRFPLPHTFSPFNIYPHNKATLRLRGDLTEVGKNWVGEELEARRKLVVFKRSQTGSTIDADFKIIAPQDWCRTDITVNCIYWKEKDQAFVTSVDTIALLEQLVAVRFTVEEKNRIRRNLEGFRPMTVSKAKPDSEEFFKVIMGFPNPKPRNIEKDVKVFTWDILQHALKKIIGKYSASYASTASMIGPLPTPYPSVEPSDDYCYPPAAPEMLPYTMAPHQAPMPSYQQGVSGGPMAAYNTAPRDLAITVPPMLPQQQQQHLYTAPYGASMGMGAPVQHMPQLPSSAPPYQQYFDRQAYDHQMHTSAVSAPASAYPAYRHAETADMIMPPVYQMHHL